MLKIKQLAEGDVLPRRATEGSAGIDVRAAHDMAIEPGKWELIKTGCAWEIPYGFAGLITPRSGLALKHGITVLNSPGLIDSDYRDEVGVVLMNHGPDTFFVAAGDRIAQMVIVPYMEQEIEVVTSELSETKRGKKGFGHSGRK